MRHPFRTLIAATPSRAFAAFAAPALIAFSSLTVGCSDDPVDTPTPQSGTIALTDANNFTTVRSNLHLPIVETAAEANLDIDWSGIKKDLQCHDVDATKDIDVVMFLQFKSTSRDDVLALLDIGELATEDLVAPAPFKIEPSDGTVTAELEDFDASGTSMDPSEHYPDKDNVFLLVFQKGKNLGQGARSMVMLDPTSTSDTDVVVPSNEDCAMLDFEAKLDALTPVSVPKDGSSWVLDWLGIKNNSQGRPIARAKIDRMLIGFYAGETPETLQEKFLDLEEIPTDSWEIKFAEARTSVDIAGAANRKAGGEPFSGFDKGEGTWIMGLFCDGCQSPAPFVVTVLEPK